MSYAAWLRFLLTTFFTFVLFHCFNAVTHLSDIVGDHKDGEESSQCPGFLCGSGRCIDSHYFCDGEKDCSDGSDEPAHCEPPPCGKGSYKCLSDGMCIPVRWVCDGKTDCHDGSDENHCLEQNHMECSPRYGKFQCHDRSNCISLDSVCTARPECDDGSDEGHLCYSQSCRNHPCAHACRETPTGPVCQCEAGYRLREDDLQHCDDIDECLMFPPVCSQKCENTPGSYSCQCNAGYKLQADERSCRAVGGEAHLFYATSDAIHWQGLDSRHEEFLGAGDHVENVNDIAVSFRLRDVTVFWIDGRRRQILSRRIDTDHVHVLIDHGLRYPLAVDYDWRGRLLYVLDEDLQEVVVCESDGSVCGTVATGVGDARSMELVPALGMMYLGFCGPNPRIEGMGMDGQHSKVIVQKDVSCPSSLAVDLVGGDLYWVDADSKSIETAKLDGSGRKVLLEGEAVSPFSVAVFEDRVYWTDWEATALHSAQKVTGKDRKTHIQKEDLIRALWVAHPVLQSGAGARSPCEHNACSHVCVLSGGAGASHSCVCPAGMVLAEDGNTCRDAGVLPYLLLFRDNHLVRFSPLGVGGVTVADLGVTVPRVAVVTAVDYDPRTNVLYASDAELKTIFRISLANTSVVEAIVSDALFTVTSLGVDWVSGVLYWLDATANVVEACKLDGSNRIVVLELGKPKGMAISPEEGLLFYTDWTEGHPHIGKCHMTGMSCMVIRSVKVMLPLGITVDVKTKRIFWTDAGLDIVVSSGYNGEDLKIIERAAASPGLGLVMVEDQVYWPEEDRPTTLGRPTGTVGRLHYAATWSGGRFGNVGLLGTRSITALTRAGGTHTDPVASAHTGCSLAHDACSHLCLPGPNNSYRCKCPLSLRLGDDQHTCVPHHVCPAGQFACRGASSLCIGADRVCDGHMECPEGEDEVECAPYESAHTRPPPAVTCEAGDFRCNDGVCLPRHLVCDGIKHCSAGEEEVAPSCVFSCQSHEFQCDGSRCIQLSWVCDNFNDCDDQTDEADCTCPHGTFKCSGECITDLEYCEGHYVCSDNVHGPPDCEDLLLPKGCQADEWQCLDASRCLLTSDLCDGWVDCDDASDEDSQDCSTSTVSCEANEYMCATDDGGQCIPTSWLCDGDEDCSGGQDEKDCHTSDFRCLGDEFKCVSVDQCIPSSQVCDNINDCGDASDENLDSCPGKTLVPQTTSTTAAVANPITDAGRYSWQCRGADFRCGSGDCVLQDHVCDDRPDCLDQSDEGAMCASACRHNGGCSHMCKSYPSGPQCLCPEGLMLGTDNRTCVEVDHCSPRSGTHPVCSHHCLSTTAGPKCSCHHGYYLDFDGHTCRALDVDIGSGFGTYILYINDRKHSIFFYLHTSEHRTEIEALEYLKISKPTTFDFIWSSKELVYYDSHLGVIGRIPLLSSMSSPVVTHVRACERVAMDWVAGNLYYTDSSHMPRVWACSLHGGSENQCVAVVSSGLERPRGITLYPRKGLLFWTDMGKHPKIGRAWMDGTHREDIITTGLVWPNGVAVDMELDKLYFVDAGTNVVEVADLDGTNRRVLVKNVYHPINLVVFEDNIYLSDWADKSIKKINKFTGSNTTSIVKNIGKPLELRIMNKVLQPESADPCAGAGCGSLCLLRPGGGATCRCSYKEVPVLKQDESQCAVAPAPTAPTVEPPSTSTTAPTTNTPAFTQTHTVLATNGKDKTTTVASRTSTTVNESDSESGVEMTQPEIKSSIKVTTSVKPTSSVSMYTNSSEPSTEIGSTAPVHEEVITSSTSSSTMANTKDPKSGKEDSQIKSSTVVSTLSTVTREIEVLCSWYNIWNCKKKNNEKLDDNLPVEITEATSTVAIVSSTVTMETEANSGSLLESAWQFLLGGRDHRREDLETTSETITVMPTSVETVIPFTSENTNNKNWWESLMNGEDETSTTLPISTTAPRPQSWWSLMGMWTRRKQEDDASSAAPLKTTITASTTAAVDDESWWLEAIAKDPHKEIQNNNIVSPKDDDGWQFGNSRWWHWYSDSKEQTEGPGRTTSEVQPGQTTSVQLDTKTEIPVTITSLKGASITSTSRRKEWTTPKLEIDGSLGLKDFDNEIKKLPNIPGYMAPRMLDAADCPVICPPATVCGIMHHVYVCICPGGLAGSILCENHTGVFVTYPVGLAAAGTQRPGGWVWGTAAAVTGGVIAVLLALIAAYWCRRKRRTAAFKKTRLQDEDEDGYLAYENPVYDDLLPLGPETKVQIGMVMSASDESLDSAFNSRRDSLCNEDTRPMMPVDSLI